MESFQKLEFPASYKIHHVVDYSFAQKYWEWRVIVRRGFEGPVRDSEREIWVEGRWMGRLKRCYKTGRNVILRGQWSAALCQMLELRRHWGFRKDCGQRIISRTRSVLGIIEPYRSNDIESITLNDIHFLSTYFKVSLDCYLFATKNTDHDLRTSSGDPAILLTKLS